MITDTLTTLVLRMGSHMETHAGLHYLSFFWKRRSISPSFFFLFRTLTKQTEKITFLAMFQSVLSPLQKGHVHVATSIHRCPVIRYHHEFCWHMNSTTIVTHH